MVNTEGERFGQMRGIRTLGRFGAAVALVAWLAAGPAPAGATPPPVSDWVETGEVRFSGTAGFFRSQGLASDGQSLFFSWNLGLIRTSIDDPSEVLTDNSMSAIPADLADSGHNHIGDIDIADGVIYAPIEDGPAHAEPWVVLYDARTLQPTGDRYLLPVSVQRDGVPWVAVDENRDVLYSMEWNDTGKLFVYGLSDLELIRTVTLSQPVPRIQGAKIFRGNLYASRDNGPEKSVVAIDPETGQVTHLFDRNMGDDYEAEGIAFIRRKTGTVMATTGIREGGQGYTDMHTYRIGGDVTAPVLSQLRLMPKRARPGQKLTLKAHSSEAVTANIRWLKCIGPARKPCSRSKVLGVPDTLNLAAGSSKTTLPSTYPRTGKKPVRLGPGDWRLSVTPVDGADVTGPEAVTGLKVLRPRR